uniref:uncharacterized protein LOC122588274 n=1 Tax=Erigeron canadensis TaxID=72917 RepID=UPI001CB9D0AE|nr:uncharacterized protein LOC122588274 [Erigeron canadensis]
MYRNKDIVINSILIVWVEIPNNHQSKIAVKVGPTTKEADKVVEELVTSSKSYAAAVTGKNVNPSNVIANRRIVIVSSTNEDVNSSSLSLLLKANDPSFIPFVRQWFHSEGFFDMSISYIGGRWLNATFATVEAKDRFLINDSMKWKFVACKSLCRNFVPDERMVWIEVNGVPKGAWHTKTFQDILEPWGKSIFYDCEWKEAFSVGKLCIMSQSKSYIFEELSVSMDDKVYNVWLKEFAPWEPNLLAPNYVDTDSEVGSTDNGTDNYDDTSDVNDSKDDSSQHSEQIDLDLCKDCTVNSEEKETKEDENGLVQDKSDSYASKEEPNDDNLIHETTADCKIPLVDASVVFPSGAEIPKQDTDEDKDKSPTVSSDIFSLNKIIMKDTMQRQRAKSCPPENSENTVVSSGAPGFVKEMYLQVDEGQVKYKFHQNTSACSSFGSSVAVENSKKFRHVGKEMGYAVQASPRSFAQIVNGMNDDKGCERKRKSINRILSKYRVTFLAIQETKMATSDIYRLKSLWGNHNFEFFESLSIGRSGGILSLWDPLAFSKVDCHVFENFIVVKGKWLALNFRVRDDRTGTTFSTLNANNFNAFIDRGKLVNVALGRHKFTRISTDGLKASRLDRFLVNQDFLDSMKDYVLEALDEIVSDHRPLLFRQQVLDFGPTPFKFYNSWLQLNGFDEVFKKSWDTSVHKSSKNAFVVLKDKLKALKTDLKSWRKEENQVRNLDHIAKEIADIDQNMRKLKGIKYNGVWVVNPSEIKKCFQDYYANKFKRFNGAPFNLVTSNIKTLGENEVTNLVACFSLDEIKNAVWSCGGDKAPGPDGFSFALVKKHWISMKDDICNMVSEFHTHGSIPPGCNSSFITLIPKVSNPTIMSGFRPISLIGIQYKIIAKLIANRLALVINSVVSSEQSAFIKGRQILDGPLLLNEVIDWYKAKRKKLLLFKIDFAKAYDSLSWDFLFYMLHIMRFGDKWISWIKACLSSTKSSVLINGNPTEEFPIQRGLRQGDPMAPFLFIIAIEGLHIAIDNLARNGLFESAKINQISVSHLFYADDVMIVGEWSENNLVNISNALRFFYGISGLKINFEKSTVIGVGVHQDNVSHLANYIGCKAEKLPFKYLGIPIGASSKRISTWEPIISKFQKRLTGRKANLMSIGGRSTLISSVLGSLGNYFLSIFCMPKAVVRKLESLRASFFGVATIIKENYIGSNGVRFWRVRK